jgi:hypothetical protein
MVDAMRTPDAAGFAPVTIELFHRTQTQTQTQTQPFISLAKAKEQSD